MLARTLGLKGGWIVRSHISWRRERNIFYEGVGGENETFFMRVLEERTKHFL